jgi:hypothetical protein
MILTKPGSIVSLSIPDLEDERAVQWAALPGCLIGASRAVWLLDDPPSAAWFSGALDVRWTRDPFDRLLAAHARLGGWRIATGDGEFLRHLGSARCIEL